MRVTASALNVREKASTKSDVVTQVRRGTELTVLEEQKSWLRVRLASGQEGWVSAQHVSSGKNSSGKKQSSACESDFAFAKTPMPSFVEGGRPGLVVVEASVNARGEVTSTKVISNSTGDPALATLTEKEIRSAKFIPPKRDCQPRAFIYTYKRSF